MPLLERELAVILTSHLLALIPIGGVKLAGRVNLVYQMPPKQLARCWTWTALVIVMVIILAHVNTG